MSLVSVLTPLLPALDDGQEPGIEIPPGYFSHKYREIIKEHGTRWLQHISPEDKKAFSYAGYIASNCGKTGGIVRAKTAARDHLGRFIKRDQEKTS